MAYALLPEFRTSCLRLWHLSRAASLLNDAFGKAALSKHDCVAAQSFQSASHAWKGPLVRRICSPAPSRQASIASSSVFPSPNATSNDPEPSSSNLLRRASAQHASTSSGGNSSSSRSEAARKPRFPFDGKRKPPPGRPHAGGPAPEVAAKQDWPQQVTRTGKVQGPFEVPRKPVFAVVELGPTQFKVSPGDVVVTEKIRGVDVNDKVKLDRVLMLGSRDETIIGRPLVPKATVSAVVEEQFQDAKVLIFKKRRRKNSRNLKGHRQDLTTLRIVEIIGIDEHFDNASADDHRDIREEAA